MDMGLAMIELFNLPRQGGKTTKIVNMALKANMDILTFSKMEKSRLLKDYPKLEKDQVFTIDEAQKRFGMQKYNGTLIDNLDLVLGYILPSQVKAMSITEPVLVYKNLNPAEKSFIYGK